MNTDTGGYYETISLDWCAEKDQSVDAHLITKTSLDV
jgi:hypothetical protein